MHRTELTTGWTLTASGPGAERLPAALPAAVPGSAHCDLVAAGVIAHPYRDDVANELAWLFPLSWRYTLRLDPAELDLSAPDTAERVELAFDGLDTVATVRLDDQLLGESANMHLAHRFDISSLLDGESHTLTVDLASATEYASARAEQQDHLPSAYPTPFNAIRKMAASFGWDWGPDLRTAGIWRPVRLERWRVARLAEVRPLVTLTQGRGRVTAHVDLDWAVETDLTLRLRVGEVVAEVAVAAGQRQAVAVAEVPEAPVWWPAGYGPQPLVEAVVELLDGDDLLDSWQRRIGFRTVEVDRTPDEHGTAFTFVINGTPIFAKGVNWIPDDHFVASIKRERTDRRLDQAVAANVNLVRVWGGGIYESEDFYRACDERGLLVWQDFLLACAAYTEEEPMRSSMESEARQNIARLMSHPSLVLYNGGNENIWAHEDWGWIEPLAGRSWGGWYATELFARLVGELDPARPYAINSPYSPVGSVTAAHPNDPNHGTHHEWDVWNRLDWRHYRDAVPRFCSEFGFQGPPTWATMTEWLHADGAPIVDSPDPKNHPVFLAHQKAEDGNAKLDRGLAEHLGIPSDFADWHWATQLNQAHAVAHAIDHYRRWWPRTAGAVVWQLNDCWPVTSWAAIDYAERRKPLWYALRRSFAPRRLVFAEGTQGLEVTAINDTGTPWAGHLELSRQLFDGTILAGASVAISCAARSVATISLPSAVAVPDAPTREALVARLGQEVEVHLFAEVKDAELAEDAAEVSVVAVSGGYLVRLKARSLVKDATLLVDRIDPDATVDEALVTLPAGDSCELTVHTGVEGAEQRLASSPVFRTANDLSVLARENGLI